MTDNCQEWAGWEEVINRAGRLRGTDENTYFGDGYKFKVVDRGGTIVHHVPDAFLLLAEQFNQHIRGRGDINIDCSVLQRGTYYLVRPLSSEYALALKSC